MAGLLRKLNKNVLNKRAFSLTTKNQVNIRPAEQNETHVLTSWIEDEGWDWSTYDVTAQLKIDPNSLLVATDQNNDPIGK